MKPSQRPRLDNLPGGSPHIALIGCGAMAKNYYLPALAKQQPQVLKTLALVDENIERARKLALAFGVKQCFSDYHQVLKDIDGVIIALPTHLHHPLTIEFLSRRVPVLCEKPLAESVDKAREMVELSQKTGTALAANYQQRLLANFAQVKELIADQTLGEPIRIKYHVGEIFDWPTVSGFYFEGSGGGRGILRDRGAHVLDHICWWLGGKPKVLCSQNDSFGGSDAVAYVRFEHNKCVGEIKLSWLSKFPCRFVVEFEQGLIEGEVYYPQSVLLKMSGGLPKRINLKSETYSDVAYRMIDNFIKVIVHGDKPLVPGEVVLDSLRMVDECYAAATRFEMPWYEIPGTGK